MPVQILLIEDDAALRTEILEPLVRRRHRVIAFGSLAEALEALDGPGGRSPDAIVSDIRLPDSDGVSFYVENARRFPNTRWILMSGNHDLVRVGNQIKSAGDLPPCAVVDKPLPLRLMDRYLDAIQTGVPMQGAR
jgi:DNA-binding NtrC family response regulator